MMSLSKLAVWFGLDIFHSLSERFVAAKKARVRIPRRDAAAPEPRAEKGLVAHRPFQL
jgi:hypothetical protein